MYSLFLMHNLPDVLTPLSQALNNVLNSPRALVGWSAFLATFIASVMADEQNDRLRKGTFGALAGSSVGAVAALISKQEDLVLISIFSSACGALVGWLTYLLLSVGSFFKWGQRLLEYHVSGLKGVRARIATDDRGLLRTALVAWSQNFSRMITREKEEILNTPRGETTDKWIRAVILNWLTAATDVCNLIFDAMAEKPEYRSRLTVVIYGTDKGDVVGKHWLSYSGRLRAHNKAKVFTADSVGYDVLKGKEASPFLTTAKKAKESRREREGHKEQESYLSFFTFKLTPNAILSLDWPSVVKVKDPYVEVVGDLFNLEVAPAITELMEHWSGPLEQEVGLEPLSNMKAADERAAATDLSPRKTDAATSQTVSASS